MVCRKEHDDNLESVDDHTTYVLMLFAALNTFSVSACLSIYLSLFVSVCLKDVTENVPLVECMYLVFTRMPDKSYRG